MAGTRWVRLDVDYFDNPKVLAAGYTASRLHLASICWCGRYLTDGFIAPESLPRLAASAGLNTRDRDTAVGRLVDAGLWKRHGDGWELHDFTEMNPTRGEIELQRADWRERQRRRRRGKGGQYQTDDDQPPDVTP